VEVAEKKINDLSMDIAVMRESLTELRDGIRKKDSAVIE